MTAALAKQISNTQVADSSNKQTGSNQDFQLEDNRPEAIAQRKLIDAADKHYIPAFSQPVQREAIPQATSEKEGVKEEIPGTGLGEDRTKPQMQKDIDAAKVEVEQLVNSSETTGEVEDFFPGLQEKYQLKKIAFNEHGEIDLEINPKARISAKKLVKTGLSMADRTMDVTYKTTSFSESSDIVGTSMIANPIGPNHPQGGPPKSSSQKDLMSKLGTKKSNDSEEKYIKGHLLNDNIGGPGVDENLFPLTARANRQHHDEVEAQVKQWVNVNNYWVYYSVEVKNIKSKLDESRDENYVNADFVCRAYPLANDGSPSNLQLSKTIKSEKSANVAPVTNPNVGVGVAGPQRDQSYFGTPELSTSKKAKKGDPGLLKDLLENLRWLHDENELAEISHLDGIAGGTIFGLRAYFDDGTELSSRIQGIIINHAVAIYGKVAELAIEDDDV